MFAISKAVAVAALTGIALPAPPAHATWASVVGAVCAGSMTWEFSPPLSASGQTGTVTQQWSGACALGVVGAATNPPGAGEFHNFFGADTTATGGYSGDCELATITVEGTTHVLIGGTLAAQRNVTSGWVDLGTAVMEPDGSCPISSVTGDRVVTSAAVNVSP